jgi:hypothetical protein
MGHFISTRRIITRFDRILDGNCNMNEDLIVVLQNPATEGNILDKTTNILINQYSNNYRKIYILNIVAIVSNNIHNINPSANIYRYNQIHNYNLNKIRETIRLTPNSKILLACGQDFTRSIHHNIFKKTFIDVFNILKEYMNRLYYLEKTTKKITIGQNIKMYLPRHIISRREQNFRLREFFSLFLFQYQDEYVII